MPTQSARRLRSEARNRELFREVNERIREVSDAFGDGEGAEFRCECGGIDCTALIALRLADYLRVRSWDSRFLLFPGHEDEPLERVVERHEGWLVVQTLEPVRGGVET
jgi:hypothetical protein